MSQSEAMWIKLDADRLYVIRIYVDNVNVITGQTSQVQGQQDYFIVPDQAFVNGYKSNINALTTQFRRPPYAANSTQQDAQTIRFEVTPSTNTKILIGIDVGVEDEELYQSVVTLPGMTVKDFTRKYALQFEDGTNISARLTSQGEMADGMMSDHMV
ncbi:uncharacterized protein J4E84_007461 [Alternaria hordeiaustralica]|uniref:uncharacterized protein n=1 Tax=Alternaria hordeiaustralica TaxID=1187925 RepID=UPI0020C559CF|nr:uncharacterized protein J4E84_007461 [Alternaria hordeiaustralica]KAI4610835.1 hypothetical protein J4E80_007864 [Alternaria sp. BMP 0032]KAI4681864.1 hypothetical protein J4E84_007461 [Alternaria hordeiaustralica]